MKERTFSYTISVGDYFQAKCSCEEIVKKLTKRNKWHKVQKGEIQSLIIIIVIIVIIIT